MLITKEVEIKVNPKNVEHYRLLGYDIPIKYSLRGNTYVYDFNKSIKVKTEDLLRGSKVEVVVRCDYCGEEKIIHYRNYLDSIEKYGLYSCNKCLHYKSEKTNLTKYGIANYSTTSDCKEKVKQSCIDKFGFKNPMQSPEIRAKANETLCKNGTQKTSNQQLYLHNLYGGKINYPISYYASDICFPEEKLVIEYDGGGHDLRVTLGRLTQEEFNRKEIIRNTTIKNAGYKQMRIISSKDKLPSDSILFQMLEDAKQYFSNYLEHSWCTYDIDKSMLFNAEYKDGILYDFGELRTIKDGDFNTNKSIIKVA